MFRGPLYPLLSLLVLITSVGSAGQTPGQAASSDHGSFVTFHVSSHEVPAPMKVVRVMLGDKEIALDTPVWVEGMWMRKISVTLANVSPKTIVQCGISVMFPETLKATSGPVPSITMSLGKIPQHSLMRRDGTVQKLHSPQTEFPVPGGTLVTFKAPDGADVDQDEAYKLVDPITKVNIDMDTISFSDESKWVAGKYYVAVPPPALWQEISPEDFFAAAPAAQQ